MHSRVRRAGAFAVVGTLALATPALGPAAFAPFALVAVAAAFVVDDGPLFELFARPGDYEDGRLNGLAGFALAAAALAVLATVPRRPLPVEAFVTAVVVVAYGNLGSQAVRERTAGEVVRAAGFVVAGVLAGILGQLAIVAIVPAEGVSLPTVAFLAMVAALTAALLRAVLFERDDPLVMLSVAFVLWLLTVLVRTVHPREAVAAFAVTVVLGYAAYVLGTASVPGMLTGILLALLTIVLGGFGWFAVLVSFFGVGALATKFRYERKRDRGVAEPNQGARGTGNVLGNAAVALVAVVGFAATDSLPVAADLFRFAFAGSLATAMSDTLSSEIGCLFDEPRLITTLERVEPGTDGAVTWQGELAGVVGAVVVAALSGALLGFDAPVAGAAVVLVAGVAGMTVDSIVGATLEGGRVGNQVVNLLATFGGALASVLLAATVLT